MERCQTDTEKSTTSKYTNNNKLEHNGKKDSIFNVNKIDKVTGMKFKS